MFTIPFNHQIWYLKFKNFFFSRLLNYFLIKEFINDKFAKFRNVAKNYFENLDKPEQNGKFLF